MEITIPSPINFKEIQLNRFCRKIDFSSQQLVELPKEIGDLRHLEELNLEWNLLQCLPDEFAQLTAYKRYLYRVIFFLSFLNKSRYYLILRIYVLTKCRLKIFQMELRV